jgi:hypothetical protein
VFLSGHFALSEGFRKWLECDDQVPRQELVDTVDGIIGDALQDVWRR